MEGKIDMAATRQATKKLQGQYRKASKSDKGKILDWVVSTTRMGCSTAQRMLTGPILGDPAEQIDGRTLRSRASATTLGRSWSTCGRWWACRAASARR